MSFTKRALVAEDETSIREFVVINLQRSGYEVVEAADGIEAIEQFNAFSGEFDVALLDIMMPGTDGIEVCKQIRAKNSNIGIIMLSAKTQEMDKVTALLVGADDYVTKPFSPSELMARVDAIYRRVSVAHAAQSTEVSSQSLLKSDEFVLDLRSRTLTKSGEPIELTQVEFQIMEYFLSKPNTALQRTDILNKVWGEDYFGEEKVVDVNIRRLRLKIEDNASTPKHIITVWGLGYKWL